MKNPKVVVISVISALVVVVLGVVFMNLRQRTEIQEIVEQMEFEKEQLEDEYEELAIQFDGYQTPDIHNDSLVLLLTQEKQRVQDLLEELRAYLEQHPLRDRKILLKGSRSTKMETLLPVLYSPRLTPI